MGQREAIAVGSTSRASRFPVRGTEALSGNRVVTVDEIENNQSLIFDPSTTSRNVDLPPAAQCAGAWVFIGNLGTTTGTLVVRTSAGVAIATIGPTAANDVSGGLFVCNGTTWFGILGA
jgi:hypothetical protein